MKEKTILRNLAVAVFAAIALTVNAQHEHQTYNGPFGRGNSGTATYSYYTGDDGRRMFDGKYTYKKVDKRNGGSTYTETGQYKDDKLEGLWTLTFNGSMYGNKVVAKITLNYKNGLLDGPMNYSWRETEGGKTNTKQYVLQFHEGYLTGKASNIKLDMQIISYAFDENHQPSGLWTCRLNRPSEQWMFCIRYADGKLQESYTENMATGDRTGQRSGVGADDGEVGRPLLQEINKLLLQPYGYKEMPIRSSINKEQQSHNSRIINAEGNKYGFLGYQGYQD
jgi:hypothetical protein